MEISLICAYTIFVTYDLIDSWKILLETKRLIFRYAGFFATFLLFIYVGFEIIPALPFSNLRASFRGWYDLGYDLLTTYSVYDFVIWVIMSFFRSRDNKEKTEPIQYGFRHAGFLLISTCVACYLTILINHYIFPPVGVSLIEIFWMLIYFIFFLICYDPDDLGCDYEFQKYRSHYVFMCYGTSTILFYSVYSR